jgi:phosphohistidine swiveling domain-containing protein
MTANTSPSSARVRVMDLAEALDASTCGRKAATLAALMAAGHRVPPGIVIPAGVACTPAEAAAALPRAGAGPWAVRSSSVAEDLADASFAGQYESVLGVTTLDAVVAAIDRVRASATTVHASAYRGQHTSDATASMAVLVQRMVPARAAGVAFSANPVTGANEVVIEATRGLGDALAAGVADADRWIDVDGVPRPTTDTGVLDQKAARQIGALVRRVARERGAPQDIEWAMAGDELWLLQARPITGLPQPPQIEVPPGRWVKDTTHWSGPITPAGASLLAPIVEGAFAGFLAEFGFPLEGMRPRSFGGEVYMQEIGPGGKHDPGAPPPWWVGAIAFRVVPSLRRIARAAESALPKLELYPRLWEQSWRAETTARIAAARAVPLESLSDAELMGHLRRVVDEILAPGLLTHFRLMLPDMVALHDLATCCEELLGWSVAQTLELLAGLSTTATRPAIEIAEIAALAGDAAVAQGLDAVRNSVAGERLNAWFDTWGLRSIDLDPGAPTVGEYEAAVLGLLRHTRRPNVEETERARQSAIARARAGLDDTGRARFDRALAVAERVHPIREDNVLYTQSLPIGLVRLTLLEIGRRLAGAGQLRAAEDIVYLELDEIGPALEGRLPGEPASVRAARRDAERRWVRANPGPAFHGPAPVPPPSSRGLPAAMRRLLDAFVWEMAFEETVPPPSSSDGALVGVGASGGRVTAPVRVIRHEAELARLEAGEVLVCPSTHSSWAIAFARAAALVTDHGGMLSHPSIVAREYGIPAVVGTGTATASLVDGQVVTVDGTTGRVELPTAR